METLLIHSYLFAHDLSGKAVPAVPDRALRNSSALIIHLPPQHAS
jgi:hypothetical protein